MASLEVNFGPYILKDVPYLDDYNGSPGRLNEHSGTGNYGAIYMLHFVAKSQDGSALGTRGNFTTSDIKYNGSSTFSSMSSGTVSGTDLDNMIKTGTTGTRGTLGNGLYENGPAGSNGTNYHYRNPSDDVDVNFFTGTNPGQYGNLKGTNPYLEKLGVDGNAVNLGWRKGTNHTASGEAPTNSSSQQNYLFVGQLPPTGGITNWKITKPGVDFALVGFRRVIVKRKCNINGVEYETVISDTYESIGLNGTNLFETSRYPC